jgi:hypothetical protein
MNETMGVEISSNYTYKSNLHSHFLKRWKLISLPCGMDKTFVHKCSENLHLWMDFLSRTITWNTPYEICGLLGNYTASTWHHVITQKTTDFINIAAEPEIKVTHILFTTKYAWVPGTYGSSMYTAFTHDDVILSTWTMAVAFKQPAIIT